MPADITSQILDFGLPAPIDVQVVGVDRPGDLAVAQKLLKRSPNSPDWPTSTSSRSPTAATCSSTWTAPGGGTRPDGERRGQQRAGVAQLDQPGVAQLLGQPANRVNYRVAVQTPDAKVNSVDAADEHADHRRPSRGGDPPHIGASRGENRAEARPPPQLLSNLTNLRRNTSQQ